MNAIDILTKDHREVDMLFAELKKAGSEKGAGTNYKNTFQLLVNALSVHMQAEEEIFYPAMRQFEEEEDQVIEAYDEHNEVKGLLKQMSSLEPSSDEFQENLDMVITGVQHHVGEEEGEMFPDAQDLLGEARLEEIGQQILDLKSENDPRLSASAL